MQHKTSGIKIILLAALIAGTLDISAALIVYCVVLKVLTATQLLQSIAAALFGKTIIGNAGTMAMIGLLLHYFIAFSFATAYFLIYPRISFLKWNAVLSGLLYGIIVWLIMNLIVVPLSHAHPAPFRWQSVLRGVLILMFCIGLPISLVISSFYKPKL